MAHQFPRAGRRVAFVLSGGGSIGSIQVGMLYALYERGIAADLLVASSAGALNAAFLASRPATVATADQLARIWAGIRTRDAFPVRHTMAGLLGVLGARNHLASSRGLRTLLEKWVEFDTLEQSPIPLHVIATDLLSGAEVRLSTGSTIAAVLASAAIPGVFCPVHRDDRDLIDGGITNNTPLTHAVDLGASLIYVLPTAYACDLREPPRSAVGVAVQALNVLTQQRLVRDIAGVPDHVDLVVLPPLCPLHVSPVDFSRATELIDRSREKSRAFLARLDNGAHRAVPDLMRTVVHAHPAAPRPRQPV